MVGANFRYYGIHIVIWIRKNKISHTTLLYSGKMQTSFGRKISEGEREKVRMIGLQFPRTVYILSINQKQYIYFARPKNIKWL